MIKNWKKNKIINALNNFIQSILVILKLYNKSMIKIIRSKRRNIIRLFQTYMESNC